MTNGGTIFQFLLRWSAGGRGGGRGSRQKSSKHFGDYITLATCHQKLTSIVKFLSDDFIFHHLSSMLLTKLAKWEEKQSTAELQCALAQLIRPVDKQTVRYP